MPPCDGPRSKPTGNSPHCSRCASRPKLWNWATAQSCAFFKLLEPVKRGPIDLVRCSRCSWTWLSFLPRSVKRSTIDAPCATAPPLAAVALGAAPFGSAGLGAAGFCSAIFGAAAFGDASAVSAFCSCGVEQLAAIKNRPRTEERRVKPATLLRMWEERMGQRLLRARPGDHNAPPGAGTNVLAARTLSGGGPAEYR